MKRLDPPLKKNLDKPTKKRLDPPLNSYFDPYWRSSNDFKHVGQQFLTGKPGPEEISTHEERFQKIYSERLKQLHPDKAKTPPQQLTYKQLMALNKELSIPVPKKDKK